MINDANKFTYGFEIEGLFRIDLQNRLYDIFQAKLKGDGSVGINKYEFTDRIIINTRDWDGDEYAIGVFDTFKKMLDTIKIFENNKNYVSNKTCGMHIHIKPKPQYQNLHHTISDYQFIKNLQEFASKNLCEKIRKRIATNEYCHPYTTLPITRHRWNAGNKYQFVRNHPQGTLEFRFFSACEHKESNIQLFFYHFFRELKKIKKVKEKDIILKDKQKTIKIKQNFNIIKQQKTLNIRNTIYNENKSLCV